MTTRHRSLTGYAITLGATLFGIVGCAAELDPDDFDESQAPLSFAAEQASAEDAALLWHVRAATARFHSTTQAKKAGYLEDDHCVAVPGLGGMGHHWVNPDLVDAEFDPRKPEVLLYEPGPNGKPELVAIEYIVIDVGQPHPSFGSQPFDVGGTPVPMPHYSLHVWLWKSNPEGMFEPFNPDVSCP